MIDPPKIRRPIEPVRTTETEMRLRGYRQEGTIGPVAPAPRTPTTQAMEQILGRKFTSAEHTRVTPPTYQLSPTQEMRWLTGDLGKKVPVKELPGPEDVAASLVANKLRSGLDEHLTASYKAALTTGNDTIFRQLVALRLPLGLQRYSDYVSNALLQSESLPIQSRATSGGVDMDKLLESMGRKTHKTATDLGITLPDKADAHLQVAALKSKLSGSSPTLKRQLMAEPMGEFAKFLGTLRAVVDDANGDDHHLFVSPYRNPPRTGLAPVRLNEVDPLFLYEGKGGAGSRSGGPGERERFVPLGQESEQQTRSLKWVPQESAGRALRELLLSGDQTVPQIWNELSDTWRIMPIDPVSDLTPERQMMRIALQDADLSKGLAGDGLKQLAQMAGYDTSLPSVKRAISVLETIKDPHLNSRQMLEQVASLNDQTIVALAIGVRVGVPDERGVNTLYVTPPEKWAFQRSDSLGRAVAETIAAGDDAKAGRVLRAVNALWPDEFHDIASTDVGQFGEWQPGLHRAASEAARELNRLSFRGPAARQLVEEKLAAGLAKASTQYVPDGVSPSRPPIQVKDGVAFDGPEFLSQLEQTVAKPYPAFQDWFGRPETQRALSGLDGTTAQKLQKAITSGKIPLPVYQSESEAYQVRKSILKNMWEQALEKPIELTPSRVAFWESIGINVPQTVADVAKNHSTSVVERARAVLAVGDDFGIDLDAASRDFSESLR